MKPRKSWEPVYRFGGDKSDAVMPAALGTTVPWKPTRTKKKKRK